MKLSIIVPVYNMEAEGKLVYCMNSLVGQSVTDLEIIAVDDCSDDNSFSILQDFEQRYPQRVKAFRSPENRKQGGAKNIALTKAQGEWIGFMDADDWAAPDMYEKLLKKAEETGADMVGCDYSLTGKHSMELGQIVHNNSQEQTGKLDEAKYRLLILDSGSLVVKIYKRDIILGTDSRFVEKIFYEDNALANTWMLRARHFEYLEEPLYYYYQHEASTVHTINKRRLLDRMEAGQAMLQEAKKQGFYDKYEKELEYTFTSLFYVNTLFSAMFGMKEKGVYSFIKQLLKDMEAAFANFQDNPYYIKRVPPEEKKLIRMQRKSNLYFYIYFRLLWFYRNCRKAGKKAGNK